MGTGIYGTDDRRVPRSTWCVGCGFVGVEGFAEQREAGLDARPCTRYGVCVPCASAGWTLA